MIDSNHSNYLPCLFEMKLEKLGFILWSLFCTAYRDSFALQWLFERHHMGLHSVEGIVIQWHVFCSSVDLTCSQVAMKTYCCTWTIEKSIIIAAGAIKKGLNGVGLSADIIELIWML